MRNFKRILICSSVFFILFKPLICMEREKPVKEKDVEMGIVEEKGKAPAVIVNSAPIIPVHIDEEATSSSAMPASAVPQRLTAANKTDSPGVLISLGVEKFNTARLEALYDEESKTLSLSNKPLGDEGLKAIFTSLKHTLEGCEVENLFLENMNLTEIPYYLVTYALVNKHLKIVSLQNNRFNIPGYLPDVQSSHRNSLSISTSAHERRASIAEFLPQMSSVRPRSATAGAIAELLKGVWEHISGELEKQMEEQGLDKESLPFLKKIIIIDKRMPPLMSIDQNQPIAPRSPSKCERFKRWAEWVISAVVGAFVGALPQIIELVTPQDSSSCDMDMLHKLQHACNATRSKPQDLDKFDPTKCDTDMLQKLELTITTSAS